MPAYVVRVDSIEPVALVEDGDLERKHDMAHCTIHMQGADKYAAVEHASAFNVDDVAVFVAHGSVVPLNPLTKTWLSRTVESHTVGQGDSAQQRDGYLVPLHEVGKYFHVTIGPSPCDCPPLGTDIAERMGIEEVDLRPEREQYVEHVLGQVGKDVRVTYFVKPDPERLYLPKIFTHETPEPVPVAVQAFLDAHPEHNLYVYTNYEATELVVEGVARGEELLPVDQGYVMCRGLKFQFVKTVWDYVLGPFERTYAGFLMSCDEPTQAYKVRANLTRPVYWEVPPRALPAEGVLASG